MVNCVLKVTIKHRHQESTAQLVTHQNLRKVVSDLETRIWRCKEQILICPIRCSFVQKLTENVNVNGVNENESENEKQNGTETELS